MPHKVSKAFKCKGCGSPQDPNAGRSLCPRCRAKKRIDRLRSSPELRAKGNETARRYGLRRWYVRLVTVSKGEDPLLSITPEQVLEIFHRQNGRCYWFNVPLRPSPVGRSPSQPSLDRLDNSKPHSFENCVLACYAANIGRNTTPVGVWKKFVRAVHRHKPSRL